MPNPQGLATVLQLVDLAAVAVFAITGALVASRKQLDIVGFLWLGTITAVGGGTVRDVLLGLPVFWVATPTYVLVAAGASVLVFFTAHLTQSRYRLIIWLDAVGLALVAVAGSEKALASGAGPVVAVVMGMLTACLGGILRDILGNEPSILLRREIYITAALAGAIAYVAAHAVGAERWMATAIGFAVGFGVRGCAVVYGWSLPAYKARPGRTLAEIEALDLRGVTAARFGGQTPDDDVHIGSGER
ncbi:MAG: trimeric intracellular cation channel family protein [Hyphomicrobiaceae bacterium]